MTHNLADRRKSKAPLGPKDKVAREMVEREMVDELCVGARRLVSGNGRYVYGRGDTLRGR